MINQEKPSDPESVSKIFESLNWWMEKTYNPATNEIQSTGEAQAAIQNQLLKLKHLNVRYKLEIGKYSPSEE